MNIFMHVEDIRLFKILFKLYTSFMMTSSFTSASHTTSSTPSASTPLTASPSKTSLFKTPVLPRLFPIRKSELDGGSRSSALSHASVRSNSTSYNGTNASHSSGSARSIIAPPPLNSKEIYRLKASWKSGLETHNSFKEAGLDTIIRYKYIQLFKRELLSFENHINNLLISMIIYLFRTQY